MYFYILTYSVTATIYEYPNCNCFYRHKIKLACHIIYHENESILHIDPKIWDILPASIKESNS